ncbi:MAG: class I SAM-dependent methyltransferase [Candidatus Peribacteraceae bacterium]|jgi:2-polyprenyl-3-methyl-5-hydroxy-6-metoxy-1,4-benzoquinol methylase|nr:class I SAM-dependent methyltransferase [Candidatus Peribacteraceae bacterium]MDP7454233.1 class I SAM-dependent methyltransferase [Candidatus Peribacteraceae bacterium]
MSSGNWDKYMNAGKIQAFFVKRFLVHILDLFGKTNGKSVLDLGCAEGFVINKIKNKYPSVRCEGIDIDEAALSRGRNLHPDLILKTGDLLNTSEINVDTDVVMCLEVLEHLPDTKSALSSLRTLNKNYLILSVPNEPLFRISNFLRLKYILRFGNRPDHVHCWGRRKFSKIIKDAGFEIIDQRYPFPWQIYLLR